MPMPVQGVGMPPPPLKPRTAALRGYHAVLAVFFAFENELLSDLEGIPESAVPFLNAEQIGRVQQKNDNGVFEGRLYIPTVHYDRPEFSVSSTYRVCQRCGC